MSKVKKLLLSLGCVALFVVVCVWAVQQKAIRIKERRKRDFDAMEIAQALWVYRSDHEGHSPVSLKDLEFTQPNVDVSPFKLLPEGSRTGKLAQDVLVEDEQRGNTGLIIRIYSDGSVCWEPR